jgi:dolichyl-diphosphooligosaccharide--protein glycosyltransferase
MSKLSASLQGGFFRGTILALIGATAFLSRLFSVIRYESVIHEFDPWFNYRTTQRIAETGFYEFLNWFDDRSWYPLGRVVGGTVYPGLMLTAGLIHKILNYINLPVDVRNVCVFFAPVFSALTAYSAYLFTSELKDTTSGLLAAIFLGVAPGYISRSVAGSYDNEGIAIFLLVFTFYLWIKAVKMGSAVYGALAALFYFYMVSAWGGYVYIINMIPLHVLALILIGRYSNRLYVSYCTFYVLGTLASMQIPFVGFQPTLTSEHMGALGVFGLLQLVAFANLLSHHIPQKQFKYILIAAVVFITLTAFGLLVALTYAGKIAPWTGRFYSLWDTGYAKIHIPIIASVSEHQPPAWGSFFFDLHVLMLLFPAGVYFCFRELRDEHVFIVIYAITASYFAGVMVRLLLTLTPLVCITAGVAMSKLMDSFLTDKKSTEAVADKSDDKSTDKPASSSGFSLPRIGTKLLVSATGLAMLITFIFHSTWVTSNSYSSPSIVLSSSTRSGDRVIIDDFREAYYWLRQNSHPDAKILSWWDYGYQLAGMANRTVIVDNNTWNNTHIATVGKVLASNEDVSYEILRKHDVDYVLVIYGGLIGYSGDDINKFLWMVRIAQGVYPDDVKEASFFNNGQYRIDDEASKTMKDSVMFKTTYYGYNKLFGGRAGQDRVRGSNTVSYDIELHTLEEAFTSENWIVRVYKVKDLDNLGRKMKDAHDVKLGRPIYKPLPKPKKA